MAKMAAKSNTATNTVMTSTVSIDQSSLAWKIFNTFISDAQFAVTQDELRKYALNELKIPAEKIPEGLMENLPIILVTFMNMWSGWHFKKEFDAGKFPKDHYFQRFQKFMTHKIRTLSSQYANATKGMEQLTVQNKNADFSPYSIYITCPAHMLNTIVFSNVGDDIIMKQHLGIKWHNLTPVQLLNWPYISVTLRTADFHITREQATEFTRYLNFLPQETGKHTDQIIDNTECFGRQEAYSYDYLEKYVKVYLESLKAVPEVSPSTLHEAQVILYQFLEDVRYINVRNSMATNTKVLFRLSPVSFIRNKKLMKTPNNIEDARIGYCEIITPKIQLTLHYFKPKQLDSNEISFEYTERIKNAKEDRRYALPHISYKCLFCLVEYVGVHANQDILKHLQSEHKMEQHVRCTICKKQFDVLNLAACRWRHKCAPVMSKLPCDVTNVIDKKDLI